MNENETAALVRAFDRAYINGKFVTPHGTQVVDLAVCGKTIFSSEIRNLHYAELKANCSKLPG